MADSSPFLAALNKPKAPLPSASIGQYVPTTPTPFSPKSAAAVNPMLAPQFDTSYAPQTPSTPSYSSSQFSPVNVPTFKTFGSSYAPQQSYGGGSAPRSNGNVSVQPQQGQQMPALQDFSQQQFQVQAPFQSQTFTPSSFNGERSGVNLSPIDRTSETIGAPTRDLSTGQISSANFPSDPNGPVTEFKPFSVDVVPVATNRLDTLGQNIAAIGGTPDVQAPSIGENALGNLAESRLGKYLGGMTTYNVSQGGSVDGQGGIPVFPKLAELTQTPAYGQSSMAPLPATTPAPTPAVNQFNVDQNASANIMNPSSGNAFANQSNVLTAPAQSAMAQDPNSSFNVEPIAATEKGFGKAPQLTDKYGKKYDAPDPVTGYKSAADAVGKPFLQLQTPEDPIIAGLKGIIEKDGIDYGVVEGREGEFVQVSPERKAAFEKRGREFNKLNKIDGIGTSTDANGFRQSTWETSRNNPDNWNATQKKNFEETGSRNMSAAGLRAWNAGAPARAREEAKRVAINEKADRAKAREREKEDRISENERTPQTMKERRAFELALDREYKEIERYEEQQAAANSRLDFQQQVEQQKLAQTASYQNRQLAAGEAEAAALAAYRARASKTQEELNIINSLPISQEQKNALIYGKVGGDVYDYPGGTGTTLVTPTPSNQTAGGTRSAIPQAAINSLLQNPNEETAGYFDLKYGAGSANKILNK
jgi:hypothetical protein